MENFEWSRLVIERHYKTFSGISEENVSRYEYSPSELISEPEILIKGRDIPDYHMSIQSVNKHGIVFFEEFRGNNSYSVFDSYQSHGVIILNAGDDHKTPTSTLSYNQSLWCVIIVE